MKSGQMIQGQALLDLITQRDLFEAERFVFCVLRFGLCGRRKGAISLRRSCSTTRTTQPGAPLSAIFFHC
eukprot:SAG25_NODE_12754_length_275_cov_1.170455_1_plen_69_part_10